ncbi:MAG: CHAT domain-containing protein, partial [Cyanobacteria bacterium J06642_11]
MVATLTRSVGTASGQKDDSSQGPPPVDESVDRRTQYKNEIVILVSAPLVAEDLSPIEGLAIQKEVDEIVSIIEDLEADIAIEVTVKIATTESLLQIFAQNFRPAIIHFIGHGIRTDQGIALLLEDAVGRARPFTSEDLKNLLANRLYPPCSLALLNACHSEGLADSLIDAGVPHIVAVNAEDEVLDVAARSFSRHFYQALFNEYPIIDAFYH